MPSPLKNGDKILIGHPVVDGCILGNMVSDVKQVKHCIYPDRSITETKPGHHYIVQHVEITWQMWLGQDLPKLNLVYDFIYKIGDSKNLILVGGKQS